MPAVAEAGGAADRVFAVAADPDRDRRLLHGLGQEDDVGEVAIFAAVARVIAGPKLSERRDVFVGDFAALLERLGAQDFEFFLHPADAGADDHAPAG